ncbi:AAA family ATPase [Paenibacillus sp. sgz500992]|uniref:AAA family ATPase n=1 Tax=Paenibacillus sp. sgz500992 TaxID=3242476 RepID=UPI0036D2A969
MIIWINGAFGSGKTETAYALNRRIPQSFVFDPENTGYYIRDNIPHEISQDDFQDHPLWREINYSMLKYIESQYSGTIIVPMTITDSGYFMEIVGRLRQEGVEVHHFTLCASQETLLRRLNSRGDSNNSWPAQQIERCLKGLGQEIFQCHLDNDQLTVEEVVEAIALQLGITLLPA